MKKYIQVASVIVLIVSIIWTVKSNFDYEPIIVSISAVIAIFTSSTNGNTSSVNGYRNKLTQDTKHGANNSSIINGDENDVIQT